MKGGVKILDLVTRLVAAGIFGYSAFMKFAGAETALIIFRRIGMEPAGRYGVAVLEIITIILLLTPKLAWRGAILGALMMFGAICMHLTIGMVNVNGDGGLMFASAIVVLLCCISILVMHKAELETELN